MPRVVTLVAAALALEAVACGDRPTPPPQPPPARAVIALADTTAVFDRAILWHPATPHSVRPARVAAVYDGDTIRTDSGEVVRFLGINTPEIAHPEKGEPNAEPFGDEAYRFLRRLVERKRVRLIVPHERPTDLYGRTLALVECNGKIVNMEMIRAGLAKTYFIDNRAIINEWAWYSIQDEVRHTHKGVWSLDGDTPADAL